ncbi:MAG: hypothetical protein HRU05_18475, partial [Oceanospirillaceae bacterium]|nr:hypothetical protein [Oceanospirillaceae bacterium]
MSLDSDMQDELMNDIDPAETAEWLDALESVAKNDGDKRAEFILSQLGRRAQEIGVGTSFSLTTPYRNTIAPVDESR